MIVSAERLRVVVTTIVIMCYSHLANADQDAIGTKAHGMGGALRASASGITAPSLNPATMPLAPQYAVGVNYHYRTNDSGHIVTAGVVDAATTQFAAGLNYSFISSSPHRTLSTPTGLIPFNETITTHQVNLSGSYPIGNFLCLGVTSKYVNSSSDLSAGTGPAGIKLLDISKFTMEAGALIRLFGSLNLAVVGYNLIGVDDQYFPRTMGVGASYRLGETFLVEFDPVIDFTSDPNDVHVGYQGGAEFVFNPNFALRSGAFYDGVHETTSVSGGFSLVSPRASLEFAYRQMIDGGSQSFFAVSLQFFLM